MKDHVGLEPVPDRPWPGWCCSYCSGPLDERAHGLVCAAEGRWFATDRGVHRLLPEERRGELLPLVELERRVWRDEGGGAVDLAPLGRALDRVGLMIGPGPWRVLDAGAGRCQTSARLVGDGHRVVAVDVSLDEEVGLLAADRLVTDRARLLRAEAEIESLPLEPRTFDVVVANGSLVRVARIARALVELRRVTRRGGVLLVTGTPVYRRRPDGEADVADALDRQMKRYAVALPRETFAGYLVLGELRKLFGDTGWTVEVHDWPARASEWLADAASLVRHRRRRARHPVLLARRDG